MRNPEPERNPVLRRLDAFVGKWDAEIIFPGNQPLIARAPASFEWLDDRRFFLIYRVGTEGSEYPVSQSMIGADDAMEAYTILYSDSRGVTRIYQMSLRDGVWRQWRDDPTFSQRFSATFSEDGHTIKGAWEKSEDGKNWEHDFDLIYRRVSD